MRLFIWNILNWLDNNINHTFFDWVFSFFECENKDGSNTLSYIIWLNTCYKYCEWVNINLSENWNIDNYDKRTIL